MDHRFFGLPSQTEGGPFFDRGISMRTISLGSTGIVTPQNAFGALPIQRVSEQDAVALVRRAFEGGMTFFDTARA